MLMSIDSYQFDRAKAWQQAYYMKKRKPHKSLTGKKKKKTAPHKKQKRGKKKKKPKCYLKGRIIFGFTDKPHCDTQQDDQN